MDSLCCRAERCDGGGTADDDVTSLLDDTVTVGSGVCDTVIGRPESAASVELVMLATFIVTTDVRLRRSNISDDMLDELEVLATVGMEFTAEFTDRLNSLVFTLCFACRRSHISSRKHSPRTLQLPLLCYSRVQDKQ